MMNSGADVINCHGALNQTGETPVPVQLEDERPVHDGEAQQADPAQQEAPEDTRLEVRDHDLRGEEQGNERQLRQ